MSKAEIRRIVVAVDCSAASRSAYRAAVELAASSNAELVGLFVEDVELLRSADLPLTSEVGSSSAMLRSLERRDLESQLRVQADRARRELERVAAPAGISWSFQVVRGAVAASLQSAAGEGTIVAFGVMGHSMIGVTDLGAIVRGGRGWYLLSSRSSRAGSRVQALLDDPSTRTEVLSAAETFAAELRCESVERLERPRDVLSRVGGFYIVAATSSLLSDERKIAELLKRSQVLIVS